MIKTIGCKKAVDLMLHHGGVLKQIHGRLVGAFRYRPWQRRRRRFGS